MKHTLRTVYIFMLITLVCVISAEPISEDNVDLSDIELNIEYQRYLKEVSQVLNDDEGFQKAVSAGSNKQLDQNLKAASEETRSKLDELKRIEMNRLKSLHKQSMKIHQAQAKEDVASGKITKKKSLPKIDDGHIDKNNPTNFVGGDLQKLIAQTTNKLAGIDKMRKNQFKQHKMDEAMRYKKQFRDLSPEEQEQKLKEHLEKAKQHAKLDHPASRDQLKEVWQKTDGMDPNTFNPKTFFMLHDIDGDGLLNPGEIEALFTNQLERIYASVGADLVAKDEDKNRMREHVFTEIDTDLDGMVSMEEFLKTTSGGDFDNKEGWESVNDRQQFTDEELKEYEAKVKLGSS